MQWNILMIFLFEFIDLILTAYYLCLLLKPSSCACMCTQLLYGIGLTIYRYNLGWSNFCSNPYHSKIDNYLKTLIKASENLQKSTIGLLWTNCTGSSSSDTMLHQSPDEVYTLYTACLTVTGFALLAYYYITCATNFC